jgi:hypothetical protein
VPGVGWIIGGLYFMGNIISTEVIGKNIGENLHDAIQPQSLDNLFDDIEQYYSN